MTDTYKLDIILIMKWSGMNMKKYKAWYGLSGGFGGARDFEIIEEENEDKASEYARELACQTYESYVGLHELRDCDQIAEDEGLDIEQDEEGINEIFNSERENWLDYWVEEYNEANESKE